MEESEKNGRMDEGMSYEGKGRRRRIEEGKKLSERRLRTKKDGEK